MALGEVLFVAEDFDVSSDEAVGDASAAVDVGAFHDDGVLYLGVADGCVVSYARVGADESVGADLAVVPDYDRASYHCSAVDDCVFSYFHVVCYGCRVFYGSVVVGSEVVEDELVRFEEEFGVCDRMMPVSSLLLRVRGLSAGLKGVHCL